MTIDEKIERNHELKRYSTFQVGGLADFFLEAKTREELLAGVEWAELHDVPVFVFGGGSNLLFDDAGFRGLVIRVRMNGLSVEGERIVAEAGVRTPDLVNFALEQELTGLEPWSGLPGTVGGAVFGNAGCFGLETVDFLESAEVYFAGEGVKNVAVNELGYSYRHSKLKEEGAVVLSARFKMNTGDAAEIEQGMKDVSAKRRGKQPPGLTTGSMFKNPSTEQPAGMLIDQCGLKGHQIGGAKISEHHGNFFMNAGGATAADILELVGLAQDKVREQFGLELEREVIFLAEDGVRSV